MTNNRCGYCGCEEVEHLVSAPRDGPVEVFCRACGKCDMVEQVLKRIREKET